MVKNIVILGGGMAGVSAALGAARRREELFSCSLINIIIISQVDLYTPRPRLYERYLNFTEPLSQFLSKIDVRFVLGEVTLVDAIKKEVVISNTATTNIINYDILIYALGSSIMRPQVSGDQSRLFNINDINGATALREHIELKHDNDNAIVIIGAGFTGIELATQLSSEDRKVILIGRNEIADSFGASAAKIICDAFVSLGVSYFLNHGEIDIGSDRVTIDHDKVIISDTIVWCGGVEANSKFLNFDKSTNGRVVVNSHLQSMENEHVFVIGDCAYVKLSPSSSNYSMMTCQHGMIQGPYAGYNAVSLLLNKPMLEYTQELYITCLDLGNFGALLTTGFTRDLLSSVVSNPQEAKKIKVKINDSLRLPSGSNILINGMPSCIDNNCTYEQYIRWSIGE